MSTVKLAIDPLWQSLCPAWKYAVTSNSPRLIGRARLRTAQCLNKPRERNFYLNTNQAPIRKVGGRDHADRIGDTPMWSATRLEDNLGRLHNKDLPKERNQSLPTIYSGLRLAAVDGNIDKVMSTVRNLIEKEEQRPNLEMYNALILVNVNCETGAAWRVVDLLNEMEGEGISPDAATCHAVLKVVAVHSDHLLRDAVLEYMQKRWMQLSEEGRHDVAAGRLREGLLEQAVNSLYAMRDDGIKVEAWLLDMFIYALCDANEIDDAYFWMQSRHRAGELNISRSVWRYLLDAAATNRHHAATEFVWNKQVELRHFSPPSGTCLHVLTTAADAGNAVLATNVMTFLGNRGTPFQPIHYELLVKVYMRQPKPDVYRALSVLTLMTVEKISPSSAETRELYFYLRDQPWATGLALEHLRFLHGKNRTIPIAALNLIIECYAAQSNLKAAVNVYKQIHTFAPINLSPAKSFANIETFNHLLRGCRKAAVPDIDQAVFLVDELLALDLQPNTLTFDRLILICSDYALRLEPKSPEELDRVKEGLAWGFRHFTEMRNAGFTMRFASMKAFAVALATFGDARCWTVLQVFEDMEDTSPDFERVQRYQPALRQAVETAWAQQTAEQETVGANYDLHSAG